ncbi:uncharacterized protein B0H64DRAFT_450121 [Chaetomium fimeti]|uniref:OTU domain-containing protein n=1 Tax=Chaetomium fimeti TaxID=1854472 RepID=A0AAE0LYG9_9PEZI|nr:hypothetical protein B0H64DRAFT_450121 [Chaetomium fimeti]
MSSPEAAAMEESLEQMQARHRKEQRDLQSRVTSKKKNATKKTRKFVNDECAELERQLKERQGEELRKLSGEADDDDDEDNNEDNEPSQPPPITTTTTTTTTTDDLAHTLATTTLSQQPPSKPQSQPQNQQQPPQQQPKRNRQKERLARRAAEQEAAAAQAAAEAAAMPDRRELERRAMQRAFEAHALREHEIAPDGHCLFSAVADQLRVNGVELVKGEGKGGEVVGGLGLEPKVVVGVVPKVGGVVPVPEYRVVRGAAADWIAGHGEAYAGFLEEGVEGYVGKVRDTAEWGGELELSALANAYGVEIRVVQGEGRVEVVKPDVVGVGVGDGKGEGEGAAKGEGEAKTLWLAYYRHGYGLGEHYNSLRKAEAA